MSEPSSLNDQLRRLASEAIAGSEEARDELARRVQDCARPHVCKSVRQDADQRELLQEIWISVDEDISRLVSGGEKSPAGFVYLVTRRRIVDYYRRLAREVPVRLGLTRTPEEVIPASAGRDRVELLDFIQYVRARAVSGQRELIDLVLEGLTNAEIAKRLGVNPGTVTRRIRALGDIGRKPGEGGGADESAKW